MKTTICAAVIVLFGAGVSHSGEALDSLRASVPSSVQSAMVVPAASGYSAEAASLRGTPSRPLEWVSIPGGKFNMGTTDNAIGFEDSRPAHAVAVKTFEMAKTAVTVEQYAECVLKGQCTQPGTGGYCNWGMAGRQLHPVNCVSWEQANQYARFKDARLPSESEWEYAATSGGRNQKYPWGGAEASCDKAVMYRNGGYGCGTNGTMPVCSKPAGNTAQGLCDMAGNVWQWVQDSFIGPYAGVPADGSAFENAGSYQVLRGGSFNDSSTLDLRSDYRINLVAGTREGYIGFRLARSTR